MRRYETYLKGVIILTRHNLYVFRCDKKLKQSEMAEKTGVSRRTYGLVENGKRDGSQMFWSNLQREFDVPDSEMYSLMKLDERTEQ